MSTGLESGNRFAAEIDGDSNHPYKDEARDYTAPGGQQYKLLHGIVSRNTVTAHHRTASGAYRGAGYLNWMGGKPTHDGSNTDGGVIYKAHVSGPHQRRGLASAMLDFARDKNPDKDIRHSTALSEDGKAWAEHHASMIDEYRWDRDAQDQRAEKSTGGYRHETDSYYGRDGEGDAKEKRVNLKDYLKQHRTPEEGEESNPEHVRDWFHGADLGEKHKLSPTEHDVDEFNDVSDKVKHADHFVRGYVHGWENAVPHAPQRIAVMVGSADADAPIGMRVVAHVSGNSVNILHCPFCGSGAVIGRSDGTIECGYCTTVFTVQVQPAYNGFPQSVDGSAYPWPGSPDPGDVLAPQAPPGTNLAPGVNDPSAMQGPGGMPPMDGPPDSSDPADGGDPDAEGEDGEDDDKPAFLKGKGDDKKSDKKKGDNPFAKKKSSAEVKCDDCGSSLYHNDDGDWVSRHNRFGQEDPNGTEESRFHNAGGLEPERHTPRRASYRAVNGAELPLNEFLAHIAIQSARDPLKTAQKVAQARARGTF